MAGNLCAMETKKKPQEKCGGNNYENVFFLPNFIIYIQGSRVVMCVSLLQHLKGK